MKRGREPRLSVKDEEVHRQECEGEWGMNERGLGLQYIIRGSFGPYTKQDKDTIGIHMYIGLVRF